MEINHISSTVKDDVVSTQSLVSSVHSEVIHLKEITTCRHSDASKDSYCYKHRTMACRTCKVAVHSFCPTEDIPDTWNNIDHAAIDQLLKDISDTKGKIKEAVSNLWKENTILTQEKQNAIKMIKEFKAEIQKELENFEKNTIEKLDSHILEYQRETDAELKKAEAMLIEIEEQLKGLQESEVFTKEMYVEFKQSKKMVDEENDRLYKLKIQVTKIDFTKDSKFSSLLHDSMALGDCQLKLSRDPKIAYEIKDKSQTQLGQSSAECNITGICVMPDGTVLLADRSKKIVQRLFPNTHKVKDAIKFSSEPWTVCAIRKGEAVVSFPEEQKNLKFIGLGSRMRTLRYLKLRHICRAVAFHDNELFVSDQGIYVYCYRLDGHLIRKFCTDQSETPMLSDFRSLAVNETLVVLADWSEGLLVFDKHGRFLWKYSGGDMKRADGVCFDECGNVLVCGSQSINILQLDKDGNKISELANTENDLVYPTAICFDEATSTVIVAQQEADVIFYRVI